MATLTESAPSLVSEVNLAHYLELLRRRWFLLVIGGVLGAALMFLYSTLQPPRYAANADIAIVRSGTVVNFTPTLRTISDTDPNALGLEQVTRRRSLLAIGSSPALAQQVINELGAQLPEGLQDATRLTRRMMVEGDGDLIQIKMTADSPELAALVVNAWAKHYIARVNELFGEASVTANDFQAQAEVAKQDYALKQRAVEAYVGASPIPQLQAEQTLLLQKTNAQVSLQVRLSKLEADVKALRALIASGQGDAALGEDLAKLLLQVNTFNTDDLTPFRFDLPVAGLSEQSTRAEQLAQLDALLKTIDARQSALDDTEAQTLFKQFTAVQAQLEQAQAQFKELQAARDTAWEVYQLLVKKVGETNIANSTQNQTVRLANPAVPSSTPIDSRQFVNTLLGAMAGVVVGAAVALFVRAK